jgi:hypothetical protein
LTRFDPAPPARPSGLTATAGDGQVSLSWIAADNAAGYNLYYATSSGVTKITGIRFATTVGTSVIVTGLTNDTPYYFVVTAVNSNSESGESNQMSATPVAPGNFSQADLAGSWNFNVLVSGAGAGWMRGKLDVDAVGAVTFSDYLDSSGNVTAPAGLFPALFVSSSGRVRDADQALANFQGILASNRNLVVGSSPAGTVSRLIAILQRQVPGVTFSAAGDIKGFGNAAGGSRRFVYHQISSGSLHEWEYAVGQIGGDQTVQYATLIAPSNPVKPGNKSSSMTVTGDGIVTESLTLVTPQPTALIDRGVMSADKSFIVGTATDTSGASPKYILRIYQEININPGDTNTIALADLQGTYGASKLFGGAGSQTAAATLQIDALGAASYSAYLDSSGSAVLPSGFKLAIDSADTKTGILADPGDTSFHGKLSYFKDLLVSTRTDSSGLYSLFIGVK